MTASAFHSHLVLSLLNIWLEHDQLQQQNFLVSRHLTSKKQGRQREGEEWKETNWQGLAAVGCCHSRESL
jgi:hypothetical protein